MGLDWVCLPKKKESNIDVGLLETRLGHLGKLLDKNFEEFCESLGEEVPRIYPNELSSRYDSLPATIKLREEFDKTQEELESHLVLPEETIKAPRIGIDRQADEWIKSNWDCLPKAEGMTVDGFIKKFKGQYVIDAVKGSPGVAKVSGIFVSATSFRGKVLRFVNWLDPELIDQSYNDMDPDELYEYGHELLGAANRKRAESGIPDGWKIEMGNLDPDTNEVYDLQLLRDVETVRNAAEWCIFWGENGHPMHAWY